MTNVWRLWFVFELPTSRAYVPADTEAAARAALTANSYKGAPVASWPCVGSFDASRQRLVTSLLCGCGRLHAGSMRKL